MYQSVNAQKKPLISQRLYKIYVDTVSSTVFNYFLNLAYLVLNLSIRPAVSISFFLPV